MRINEVYEGDCLEVMRQFPDNCIDTIITDPPYGLSFMGKDWDYGLPGVAYWREALRIAKPGATLMAFGGTRTHHRLVCAIEDAGWEIRDCISYFHDGTQQERALMASLNEEQLAAYLELHYPNAQMSWVYGSGIGLGFDVSKAIDKQSVVDCPECSGGWVLPVDENYIQQIAEDENIPIETAIIAYQVICGRCGGSGKVKGAEREVIGTQFFGPDGRERTGGRLNGNYSSSDYGKFNNVPTLTAPSTPLAKQFDGWNTRLKPAHEPIVVAMKPVEGGYAHNAEKWGVSGIWVDGARISTQDDVTLLRNNQEPLIPDGAFSCIHSFLRDFYDYILSSAHCYNIDGTSLKRNAVDLGDKLPAAFLCEPCLNRHSANDGVCDRNLSSIQDFRSDCLIYHHFCDGLSRLLLEDVLNIQTLRNDVLKCIHPSLNWNDQDAISYDNLYRLCIVHLSNCDDIYAFLSRLYSLLSSMPNYTTLSANPQRVDFIPEIRNKVYGKGLGGKNPNGYTKGRWPANVIHSGEPGVEAEFAKAGVSVGGNYKKSGVRKLRDNPIYGKPNQTRHAPDNFGDTGTPSRYFAACPPDPTQHPDAARFHYYPKASTSERSTPGNNHPTQKPLSLIKYLCRLTKTPTGGIVLDPFAGSGTTALSAISEAREFILIEKEPEYAEICRRRIAEYKGEEIAPKEIEITENETVKQMSLW